MNIGILQGLFQLLFEALGVLFLVFAVGFYFYRQAIQSTIKNGVIEVKGLVYKIVPADVVVKK